MRTDRRGFVAVAALGLAGCGRARSTGGDITSKTDVGTQRQGDIEVLSGLLALEQQSVSLY